MPRSLLTFDLDGVLCRPPFGINPGRGRRRRPGGPGRFSPLWLTERWRYHFRGPMEGAVAGVRELAERYDWAVVTARGEGARSVTEAWLVKHFGMVPRLVMRESWRETSAQFKARAVSGLSPVAHFEDDPATAEWLAELGIRVFLVDWPRNAGLQRPGIVRISRIDDAMDLLRGPGS